MAIFRIKGEDGAWHVRRVHPRCVWQAEVKGWKPIQPSEYRYWNSTRDTYRVIFDGLELPYTDKPILVVGRGRSSNAVVDGALLLAVNPHAQTPYGQDVNLSFGIDMHYYADHYRAFRKAHPLAVNLTQISEHVKAADKGRRSHMGDEIRVRAIHTPIDGYSFHFPPAVIEGVIWPLRVSGPHAVNAALCLTTGPVILAGFDLRGYNEHNVEYGGQWPLWRAWLSTIGHERLYAHPDMIGPIAESLPTWGLGKPIPELVPARALDPERELIEL